MSIKFRAISRDSHNNTTRYEVIINNKPLILFGRHKVLLYYYAQANSNIYYSLRIVDTKTITYRTLKNHFKTLSAWHEFFEGILEGKVMI